MYFSKTFIASVLLGCSAATNHEAGASHTVAPVGTTGVIAAAPSASAHIGMVNTHVVRVGGPNGTLRFYPDTLHAQIGDLVQFQFYPKNHSVVQSTFDQPCRPIHDVMPNKTDAFFSGFMPTNISQTATTDILTYTIRVTNAQPMWYYCSQGQHCQGGMVGVINPPANNANRTVQSFAALAKLQTQNLSPGQSSSGSGSSGAPSAGSPATPTGSDSGAGAGGPAASGSSTASAGPAQQSTNAAPGRLMDSAKRSVLGLGLGGLVAFVLL